MLVVGLHVRESLAPQLSEGVRIVTSSTQKGDPGDDRLGKLSLGRIHPSLILDSRPTRRKAAWAAHVSPSFISELATAFLRLR